MKDGSHCRSCNISPILQQEKVFAEWAFDAHIVDWEVKMKGCHRDRDHRKHKQSLTHSCQQSTSYWWNYPGVVTSYISHRPTRSRTTIVNTRHTGKAVETIGRYPDFCWVVSTPQLPIAAFFFFFYWCDEYIHVLPKEMSLTKIKYIKLTPGAKKTLKDSESFLL